MGLMGSICTALPCPSCSSRLQPQSTQVIPTHCTSKSLKLSHRGNEWRRPCRPDADNERFSKMWGELNDVVMGGASQGAARIITIPAADGGKCAKLSGVVNGAARVYGSASLT